MTPQELEERAFVEKFKELHCPELQILSPGKPPQPDVFASFRGGHIGIEVTQPPLPTRFRAAAESAKILDAARKASTQTPGPIRSVNVNIAIDCIPKGQSPDQSASDLVIFLNTLPAAFLGCIRGDDLPERLHWVNLLAIYPADQPTWFSQEAAFEFLMARSDVQSILDSDDRNVPGYRRGNCAEVWLLIATNTGQPGWVDLTESAEKAVYISSFDRVFFMQGVYRRVTELRIHR